MYTAETEIKSENLIDEKYFSLSHSYLLPWKDDILNETKQISKYKYNAHHLTCSCKDYRERTKLYPKRDLRRLCKHLYGSLLTEHISKLDQLTKLLIETNFWLGRQLFFKVRESKEEFYFTITIPTEKIYVFLKNGQWLRYEYSLSEDFWVNNIYPRNYDKLVSKIKKFISKNLDFADNRIY
jgi:hypothetical protein